MPDLPLAAAALERIRAHRLPLGGVDDDAIFPHYAGLSVANVAPTFAALMGADLRASPPLWAPLWQPWQGRVRRVVLVILDALGYLALSDAVASDETLAFHRLERAGILAPLTSVFPSTTTAATTSFATGCAPIEHGMLGYELFLREFSRTANMILLSAHRSRRPGELEALGLNYDTFIPVPSVAQRLADEGIPTHVLLPADIRDSGLSRLQYRGAKIHSYYTPADMWVGLRHLLIAGPRDAFISVYWPGLDTVAHRRGPDTEMHAAEIRNMAYSLGRELLDGLPAGARAKTLFVISADHGQVRSRPEESVDIAHHPGLAGRLQFDPTGEARTAYLFARQGEKAALLGYLRETLAEQFAAWDSDAAFASGLFGTGEPMAEARARMGDVVLAARKTYSLYAENVHLLPDKMPGRHGSLSPAEMLTPWLAAHLEDVS
ncbi:MAG: alkaline phosphatase family protein [Anaerolineae bacterium]